MGIRLKLVGFLLLFGFVILGTLLWSNQYVLHKTILHYVDQRDQQRLERLKNNLEIYLQYESTEEAEGLPLSNWQRLLHLSHRIDLSQNPGILPFILKREPKRRPYAPDEFEERVSLMSNDGQVILGPKMTKACMRLPVQVNGKVVAQIGYHPLRELIEQADIEFAQTQFKILTLGAILITILVLVILWPLANHFLVPIRELTGSVRALAQGDYQKRTKVSRSDEFGALQRDFNHLANTLQASLQSRNQWVADISHELRTPLTVLKGSIEAMRDGIRPLDEKSLHNLHQEVELLQHLIEDLYQLSLSDVGALQYVMQTVDLTELMQMVSANYRAKAQAKGIAFKLNIPASRKVLVHGDEKRLTQMLNNLLHNAVAYTDAERSNGDQGMIELSLQEENRSWLILIKDSEPGVETKDMQKLAERFFRTDPSRNRRSGGAGLGLAIVSRIVEAHSGSVQFDASESGGLQVAVRLPKKEHG